MGKRAYRHIILKSPEEISVIRNNGRIIAEIFEQLKTYIKPGISTLDIDQFAETYIRNAGGTPSFKGYGGFTGSICSSINDVVIHGIPSSKEILKEGDIISVDIGVFKDGFHADSANTFAVGEISGEAINLLAVTKQSLNEAIKILRPGKTLFDIANAIQSYTEKSGKEYGIIKEFVGHGVGKDLHEAPQVPNYRQLGLSKIKLQIGMVIAIEPMTCIGSGEIYIEADEWTVRTKENTLAAHFEHTIAITANGYSILTTL